MPTENRSSNTEMVSELLPCPFCGQQDLLIERLDSDASVVICQGLTGPHEACLARGPVGVAQDEGEEQPGRDKAVELWSARAEQRQGKPVPIQAVAVTSDDGEEGLRLEWLLEGGICEMEFAGQVLFALPEANALCEEDGSAYVYLQPPANPGEVERLRTQLNELISAVRSINYGPRHAIQHGGDDEPCYPQRKEWVEWVLGLCDVASPASAALGRKS